MLVRMEKEIKLRIDDIVKCLEYLFKRERLRDMQITNIDLEDTDNSLFVKIRQSDFKLNKDILDKMRLQDILYTQLSKEEEEFLMRKD